MWRRALLCFPAALVLVSPGPALAQDPPIVEDAAVSLIAASVAATRQATSMHIDVTAIGSVPGGPDGPASLDDATLQADLDVANQALAVRFDAPSLELTDTELRIVDDVAYLRTDVFGDDGSWISLEAPMMVDAILSMIPGGPRIINGDPDRVERVIQRRLARANASAAIAGEEPCAAGTCTRIHIAAPLEADASDVFGVVGGMDQDASASPDASAQPVGQAMTLDLLVDTATTRLDSVVLAQGGEDDPLTITVTIGAYDEPVTIAAPPPDEVTDWSID